MNEKFDDVERKWENEKMENDKKNCINLHSSWRKEGENSVDEGDSRLNMADIFWAHWLWPGWADEYMYLWVESDDWIWKSPRSE